MSADNGIYILSTPTEHEKFEYRIAYTSSIERIDPDMDPNYDIAMKEIFGTSKIYLIEKEAFDAAYSLYIKTKKEIPIIEYGIVPLYLNIKFPN